MDLHREEGVGGVGRGCRVGTRSAPGLVEAMGAYRVSAVAWLL